MQNSFLKLYNRKLYINVIIKMAKKGTRVVVTLECTEARTSSEPRRSNGISRYTTEKNKRNTTERLELKKFNPHLNKRTWLVIELEDKDGYLDKISFPMEKKHSQIRIGSNIRCLVSSNNRNFDRDIYLTDAWLPDVNIWVGEYPYLLRPAFEEICYIYLK